MRVAQPETAVRASPGLDTNDTYSLSVAGTAVVEPVIVGVVLVARRETASMVIEGVLGLTAAFVLHSVTPLGPSAIST